MDSASTSRTGRRDPRLVALAEDSGYEVQERIGAGGMGIVYRAVDADGTDVAIKLLRHDIADDPLARERLGREVAAQKLVRSENIVRILDAELDSPDAFIVTEFVPGPTLEDAVREQGGLHPEAVREIGLVLGEALSRIHEAGVIHRDLKPSNVLLRHAGQEDLTAYDPDGDRLDPVIIDFGIAIAAEASRLTSTGLVMGTAAYLDPEVIVTNSTGEAGDWWALAALLSFAATGREPFGTGRADLVLRRAELGEIDVVGAPTELAAWLRAALTADPSRRPDPATMLAELAELDLTRYDDPGPTEALEARGRTVALPAAGAGATAVLGAGPAGGSPTGPSIGAADDAAGAAADEAGATQVLSAADATRALSAADATQALPAADATQALPAADATQALPAADATQVLPVHGGAASSAASAEGVTEAIPAFGSPTLQMPPIREDIPGASPGSPLPGGRPVRRGVQDQPGGALGGAGQFAAPAPAHPTSPAPQSYPGQRSYPAQSPYPGQQHPAPQGHAAPQAAPMQQPYPAQQARPAPPGYGQAPLPQQQQPSQQQPFRQAGPMPGQAGVMPGHPGQMAPQGQPGMQGQPGQPGQLAPWAGAQGMQAPPGGWPQPMMPPRRPALVWIGHLLLIALAGVAPYVAIAALLVLGALARTWERSARSVADARMRGSRGSGPLWGTGAAAPFRFALGLLETVLQAILPFVLGLLVGLAIDAAWTLASPPAPPDGLAFVVAMTITLLITWVGIGSRTTRNGAHRLVDAAAPDRLWTSVLLGLLLLLLAAIITTLLARQGMVDYFPFGSGPRLDDLAFWRR
ncbi:protein kinase domain-containing protein [Brachybacterium sp. DNPG3]